MFPWQQDCEQPTLSLVCSCGVKWPLPGESPGAQAQSKCDSGLPRPHQAPSCPRHRQSTAPSQSSGSSHTSLPTNFAQLPCCLTPPLWLQPQSLSLWNQPPSCLADIWRRQRALAEGRP